VHALLFRVPLGPRPWLHQLRHRSSGFVRRLHSYYAEVRLLCIVHQRLRLLAFPLRTIHPYVGLGGQSRDLPVPVQGASVHARVSDHAESTGHSRNVLSRIAFRNVNAVGTRDFGLSQLNGWPARSPTDASPTPSRLPAHGLGPMWVASPSSWWTFTSYSLPVSRRTDVSIPIRIICSTDGLPRLSFQRTHSGTLRCRWEPSTPTRQSTKF
jgi:hypothetical protein